MKRIAAGAVAVVVALTLAACTAGDPDDAAPTVSAPITAAPEPSLDPSALPAPGRTVEATPPTDLGDLRGMRIATVVPDDGAASQAFRDGVRAFADQQGLVVEEFLAVPGETSVDSALTQALATEPHVVVGLGEGAVDAIAYASAQYLDQDFLLVGAQSAEPTSNVTAVVWGGATSRGSGAPADDVTDASSVTVDRATEAIASGLGSVLTGVSGIVLHLSD